MRELLGYAFLLLAVAISWTGIWAARHHSQARSLDRARARAISAALEMQKFTKELAAKRQTVEQGRGEVGSSQDGWAADPGELLTEEPGGSAAADRDQRSAGTVIARYRVSRN